MPAVVCVCVAGGCRGVKGLLNAGRRWKQGRYSRQRKKRALGREEGEGVGEEGDRPAYLDSFTRHLPNYLTRIWVAIQHQLVDIFTQMLIRGFVGDMHVLLDELLRGFVWQVIG